VRRNTLGLALVGLGTVATIVFAMALAPIELADAKPGRVVRIERATRGPSKMARVCQYQRPGATAQITCVGENDFEEGDIFEVLSEDGSFARAEVKTIKPARIDACNLGFTVDIDARVFDEVKKPATPSYMSQFAVRGLDLTAGVSKLVPAGGIQVPSGSRQDSVFMAVDADGDDKAEFLAVLTNCPAARRNVPWVPTGRSLTSYCIDYWSRSGPDWTKQGTEVFHYCQ